jgi:hypothetical protein
MSAFTTIQAAIVAAIQAVPALSGVLVQSNRTEPVGNEWARAVLVRLESSSDLGTRVLGAQDLSTVYVVECLARTTSGADPAVQADDLLSSVWAAVRALRLTIADVMDLDASPQIDWDYQSGSTPVISAAFRLSVSHRVKDGSLAPWSAP